MYKIGLYEKAMPKDIGWKEKFQVAKSAGYDYIEISIDETDEKLARLDWSDAQIRDVVSVAYGESMSWQQLVARLFLPSVMTQRLPSSKKRQPSTVANVFSPFPV